MKSLSFLVGCHCCVCHAVQRVLDRGQSHVTRPAGLYLSSEQLSAVLSITLLAQDDGGIRAVDHQYARMGERCDHVSSLVSISVAESVCVCGCVLSGLGLVVLGDIINSAQPAYIIDLQSSYQVQVTRVSSTCSVVLASAARHQQIWMSSNVIDPSMCLVFDCRLLDQTFSAMWRGSHQHQPRQARGSCRTMD